MNRLITKLLLTALLLSASVASKADEGMWLVNLIDKALAVKMQEKGLKLDPKVLYDEDAVSYSDAIVSLAFRCSGSMISQDGLMITNHHCAYSDVHALSTPENNYLENGFWAMDRSQEKPVSGGGIYFLKKVIDVTDEVEELRHSTNAVGRTMGMRKVYHLIESKYQKMYEGQGEVSCASMWSGQKYYMALYEVYKDVRLVAAPPLCIASYGAEVDNWQWPQHKGDFAIYRIYTAPDGSPAEYSPENVPLKPKKVLKVSTKGVNTGDFTMIMGYPGSTNRYASSYEVSYIEQIANPIEAAKKKEQMKIIDGWMNKDPEVRLKYADYYFGLSNVQGIREGELYCYKRFKVVDQKRGAEQKMMEWVNADSSRVARWEGLMDQLKHKYADVSSINRQTAYYRETLVRGSRMHQIINTTSRSAEEKGKGGESFVLATDSAFNVVMERNLSQLDFRVERDLLQYGLKEFLSKVDTSFWGEYFLALHNRFNGDADAINAHIWDNTIFRSEEYLREFVSQEHTAEEYLNDPLILMKAYTKMGMFNQRKQKIERGVSCSQLEKRYKDLLFNMNMSNGVPQYPDANSTMRLTYGTVGPLYPNDGIIRLDKSTPAGILEKYNPNEYIFSLPQDLLKLYQEGDWGRWADPSTGTMTVNFLTDNDITGGNSGSAVLNGSGELVGLAFDGNWESLASDTHYVEGMNKCVCVDIRYVLWVLEKYAGMDYLVKEILDE